MIRQRSNLLRWLVLGALLLPVLIPLLNPTALPCTHDNVWHQYRIVAMRDMLRHGWVFARWVPNLALGHGYPFFNYREPVPYIAGEMLALVGMPLPLVLGLIYAVSLVVGAAGAGALADDLWGGWAGWVAAVAYGLGPYVLLDALRRGNMPESVALAVLPWLFLTMRRLIRDGGMGSFIVSSLLLSGLFLSHNISSLLLAPFLGLYTVLLSVIYRRRKHWPRAFLAVGLAALVAAWFLLPALFEQDFVQLHLSRTTRNNDFHFNFVTWREMLLTPPLGYDPDYLNPPMRIPLGIGPGLLGLVGLGWILWRGRSAARRWLAGFFGIAALGYLWLATSSSVGVWEAIPLLAFVQFPWRLVGRALLPVSLLAGAVVGEDAVFVFGRRPDAASYRVRGMVALALVAALALLAWPRTFPPKGICPEEPYPTIEDVYAYERAGWIGIDPESSYFPIWVETHPESLELAEAFMRGELPERLDADSLPAGTTIEGAVYRPLRASLVISTPEAFQARWRELYFPGWKVMVDGQPVPVSPETAPDEDSGFITFPVPAGTHEIKVWFGATPLRRGAGILTIIGLVGWIGSVGFLKWPDRQLTQTSLQRGGDARTVSGLWLGVVLGIAALRLVVGELGIAVPAPRVGSGRLPEGVTPVAHAYDVGLDLIGARLGSQTLATDEELRVELLWSASARPDVEYRTSVLLIGADGRTWSPAGTLRPRGYEPPPPTTQWQPGEYAFDPHLVSPLPGTPPGTYDVVVSLFARETLEPATLIGVQGEPLGTELSLGTVELVRPSSPATLPELGVGTSEHGGACGTLALRSMTLDRAEGAPGGLVAVHWIWEAVGTPSQVHHTTLTLIGADNKTWDRWTLAPVADWWSTDRWQAGDRWLGQHVLRLPGGLETGTYTLVARVPDCESPLAQAQISVQAPNRQWTVPSELIQSDIVFGDRIRLAGYRVDPVDADAGETLTVSLAWQAAVELETSYRVFVHLVDEEGRMVDQSDGIPASWNRPTTGWAVDEVVLDSRTVTLPEDLSSGPYTLQAGIYHLDGARLATGSGDDTVILSTIPTGVGTP